MIHPASSYPLRIAILAPLEYPLQEPYAGGLEKHTVQLAAGLASMGHSVRLFARKESSSVAGVTLEAVSKYSEALGKLRILDLDLIHNNTIDFLPTLASCTFSCPVVTTLHVPPYRRLLPGTLISRLFRSAVFVAVSHDLARQWRRYTGECDIIYNGIDTERWVYRASAAPKTAIWSGRIVPEKAPHLAIRAAVKAGYRLSIAGPLTDPTYFGKYIEPYLSEEVKYIGHLDQQSLSSHIAAASVGLYTSVWREPFGLVLPEMLACGTPIAGFATGAAPELLSAQVSKLVDAEDLTALAAAIHEASALSRPGCRAYAEKSFSLSTMLLAYKKLYYSLF